MLIVTGARGVIFVGRLVWELIYLPFDLADGALNRHRPAPKPANITYYPGVPHPKRRKKAQTKARSAA